MDGVVQQPLLGGFHLGDVGDRPDDANHLPVVSDDRPGLEAVPEVRPDLGPQAEIVEDPASAILDHRVEGCRVTIDVEGVEQAEPVRGRAFERPALEAELALDLGPREDPITGDVPIEHDVAGAGQRQRAALGVRDEGMGQTAAREGVLHDGESDQHHDEHEAADQGRLDEVAADLPGDGKARRDHPDHEQRPGRHEQDGAVVAVMDGEIDDEQESDPGHGRDRDARDARGHRRIEDRESDEAGEEGEPEERDVSVAHVPAAEVEIGEQEDQQGGAEDRLGGGTVDPLGHFGQRENPLQEAEIDAGIGEYRPGQRRGGGEDDRTLHHEDDREEQGEQAGDADDDALVERQSGRFLAVGLLVPEVDLGNVRPPQLRHERHGGAGIDSDHELVGFRVVLAVGPDALARRDRGDAGPAEIRPDHP